MVLVNTTEDLALGNNDGHFGNISTFYCGFRNEFLVFEGAKIYCC